MDSNKVRNIIALYKQRFTRINKDEIYKWRAVKCFQDNWDVQASDFPAMLDKSFSLAKNLLDSGNYFPKVVLHFITLKEPETVRQLFVSLFNEEEDLIERILAFQKSIKAMNNRYFPDKGDYQDKRAVFVYLSLRYPDRYFLYKFTMFKDFARLISFPYIPKAGDVQNVLQFLSLCEIIKTEITKDNELLELHKTRINEQEYLDSSYNILTQDVIYAAVRYIDEFDQDGKQESALERLAEVAESFLPKTEKTILKGSFTNYIENEKEKKRIGDLGELLVLQYEQEKLLSCGIKKSPVHKSKSEGDGLGYDILSYDETGNEIFIEVKTTSYSSKTTFYITQNELVKSKLDSNKYFLYRLYEFDDKDNKAKYYKHRGDLTELCTTPILYKVNAE